jgi:hypothetical protein
VNGVLFYLIALLIVASAGAAVLAPRVRDAGAALLATTTMIAVLCAATGAFTLAFVQFLVPWICAWSIYVVVRRSYRGIGWPAPLLPRRWWLAAGAAGGFAILLVVVFAASGSAWFTGSGGTSLLEVLGTRAPYALIIGVTGLVVGVAVSLLLGRTSADEREFDKQIEARQARDERTRRRREDREAARRTRGSAPPVKDSP